MTHDTNILREAVTYIQQHLDKPLPIGQLVTETGVSRFKLERIFKANTGQTVHQYIISQRMEKAYALLVTSDMPLKGIIGCVGFQSVSGFIRRFRQHFHISPGALREEL